MNRVTNGELVRTFARIGLLSFGGPAGQIALMQTELVERRQWLDQQQFLRGLSLAMLLPGPEAMQLATYCGWRLAGMRGGLIAGALFVLPGAAVIAALVWFYVGWGTVPLVQAGFLGIKAAVIIIVVQALVRLGRKTLTGFDTAAIAALAFAALFLLRAPFPVVIAVAALWGAWRARAEMARGGSLPPRARAMPLPQLGLWLTLWLAPLVALTFAGSPFLATLGWFFARLAIVSFGGAYALLAYMTQNFADLNGWITTAQMIDALGLAETTPGPLILVTQFAAMLAGHTEGGTAIAVAAGMIALWALFVPCFIWVFLCAPYLERLTAHPMLAGAMHSITAAVVGVIASLSLWFALHLLFGHVGAARFGPVWLPLPASPQIGAAMLTLLAAALLLWRGLGLGWTLPLMALAGVMVGMTGP